MYSFIKDFAIKLSEAGYHIDIFHKSADDKFDLTIPEQFKQYENINYHNINISNSLKQIFIRKCKGFLRRLNRNYKQNPKNIICQEILQKSIQIISDSKYQCFVGIEKKGLIWAGILSEKYGCPLIYYNLELYLEDHPDIEVFSFLRKAEKKYHQFSGATIIPDRLRAKALLKFNEIEYSKIFYFPISVRGKVIEKQSTYLYLKHPTLENNEVLLYFGLLNERRFSTELIKIADDLDEKITLVLHGYGNQTFLRYLQSIANPRKVVFSLDFIPEEDILSMISSAYIGLALYETTNLNDRLSAFSSVKVAYYLQCGVPIIAFNSESYCELMSAYKCGELIDSIDELSQTVEKIHSNYAQYRKQAFMAFMQFYDFDKNFTEFLDDFESYLVNA